MVSEIGLFILHMDLPWNRHIVLFLIICIDNSETGRKEENKLVQ